MNKNKIRDLSGSRIGNWEILCIIKNTRGRSCYMCRCVCGTEKLVEPFSILNGKSKSCGKCKTILRKYTKRKITSIIGKRYANLTVTHIINNDLNDNNLVECVCDCGNKIIINQNKLRRPNASCGCLKTPYKIHSIIGNTYGKLSVLKRSENRQYGYITWTCICACGNTCDVAGIRLRSGEVTSCGCDRKTTKMPAEINKKVHKLTLLKEVESKVYTNNGKSRFIRYVKCLCECGNIKIMKLSHFKSGKYKSCGCLNKNNLKAKIDSDLTNTKLNGWNVVKKESNLWWCTCDKCGETRLFSSFNIIKDKKSLCTCNLIKTQHTPNFVGESYGELVVIQNLNTSGLHKKVTCLCSCGNKINTTMHNLKSGAIKDCGCQKIKKVSKEYKSLQRQMINKKFGRLLVISACAKRYKHKNIKTTYWLCICDCGKFKIVSTTNLNNDNTRSCGCLRFEIAYQGIHFGAKKQKERNNVMNTKKYKIWRKEVFRRDNNECQICASNLNIIAHHLLSYSKYPQHRTNKDNGVTLCKRCHDKFHAIYSSTEFNIDNFIAFKKQVDHHPTLDDKIV